MRRARGRFVAVEGIDGAGTTTQARLLAAALRAAGRKVHVTAEPSGGPVGALVRQVLTRRLGGGPAADGFDPGALALLFAADRLDHLAAEVEPRLAAGDDVVTDRFTLSSLAYQSLTCPSTPPRSARLRSGRTGRRRGAAGDVAWVEALNSRARAPDVTLFLRVSPKVAVARRQADTGGGELFEVPEFQRKVAKAYDRCVERLRERGERVEVLDGERPVEQVTAALAAAVQALR